MSVVVACNAPFSGGGLGQHLARVVQEAIDAEELSHYYCSRPRPSDPAGQAIVVGAKSWLFRYTPVRFSPAWQSHLAGDLFDKAVASRLTTGDTLCAFNGQALHSFRRARRLGYKLLVLESATTHITAVHAKQVQALKSYPVGPGWLNGAQIKKTLREYAEADVISVASTLTWDSFVENGVPEQKLRRRALLVDDRFKPAAERPNDGLFRIAYTGALSVMKGVPVLLEAFSRLKTSDARLYLVGGWGSRPMRQYVEGWLQRDSRIVHCPGDPLPCLQEADLYVHPSFSDGFGLAPMEAMACGVPVVVTEDTGMKELVREGETGFVVPTGDWRTLLERIEYVRDHPLLRKPS